MGAAGTGIWRVEAATGAVLSRGVALASSACGWAKRRAAVAAVARARPRMAVRLKRDERGGGYMRLLSGGAALRFPEFFDRYFELRSVNRTRGRAEIRVRGELSQRVRQKGFSQPGDFGRGMWGGGAYELVGVPFVWRVRERLRRGLSRSSPRP